MKKILQKIFFFVSFCFLTRPLFSNPAIHSQGSPNQSGQNTSSSTANSTEETHNTNLDVFLSDDETAASQYFSTCLEDDMLSECGSAAWDGVGKFFGDLASTATSVAKTVGKEALRASATAMGGAPLLNHFGAEDSYTKGMRLAKEAKESIQAIPQDRWDSIKSGLKTALKTALVESWRLSATIMPGGALGMKALNIENSSQKAMRLAYQAAEPMAEFYKKWNDPVEGPLLRKKIKQVVVSLAMNLVGEDSSCQEIAKKACSLMGEEAAPTLATIAIGLIAGAVSGGAGTAATLSANLARLATKFPRLKGVVDKAIAAIKALKHSKLSQKAKSVFNKIGELAADVKKKYHQKLQSFNPQQRNEFQDFIMHQCGAQ